MCLNILEILIKNVSFCEKCYFWLTVTVFFMKYFTELASNKKHYARKERSVLFNDACNTLKMCLGVRHMVKCSF